mmetsp:Transcript_23653/g.68082  ORF Transcript_23653/g.68082 Transcript_23653/m.68082 type:complete len:303 (-) Transcript_23653:64-972(-)|eukprot:CAMPEP_0181032180 /NCGR_PEP_ID=MMETSP1070-20121207/6609_1 /TAXON_ID=265543 /ORGANISM="Minutocellus polymorphus, Strain NH13" /LENGTH=302 /DNA_ID=CAMNT_0023109569 /DNA_START=339 /DNA_END=1247 /DNA_ORIENTATION=-
MPSGIVEVTVNAAESGCEGEAAVEAQRHSPRRRTMDRKKLTERLSELDKMSTKSGGAMDAEKNGGHVLSSSGQLNNGTAAAPSKGKESQAAMKRKPSRSRSGGEGGTESGKSSAGASVSQPIDHFSSNVSLSACSLLDMEDNADDEEDAESDEDLGPVTRKAFATCSEYVHGDHDASSNPSGSRRFASILRGCGTCGTGSYCTTPSCTACAGDGPTGQKAPPTTNNLKSFDQRGVCFSDTLVTDTHERPRTDDAERGEHFYSINDFRRFKRQARDEGHCEQQLLRMLRDLCSGMQDEEGDFG